MTATPAAVEQGGGRRLRREVGPVGMMFVSLGSIIGSGWLFGALAVTQIAGPAAILFWITGRVMTVTVALAYAEVGTMFPRSGGIARYPHYSFGSFTSFNLGWANWLGVAATAPIGVLATVQYATSYLPWLERIEDGVPVLTGAGLAISIALMAVFVVINALGVRFFARVNNVLVWWKVGVIGVLIVVLFAVSFNADHFTDYGGFAPTGSGIFGAITGGGIAVAYGGFQQAIGLAGESRNPQRDPLTVIGSLLIAGVLCIALRIAFIGAIPTSALTPGGWSTAGAHLGSAGEAVAQFGPFAAVASALGRAWLAQLLYLDANVLPGDTGMIYVGTPARMSYAMGRNAKAPASLAKLSRTGRALGRPCARVCSRVRVLPAIPRLAEIHRLPSRGDTALFRIRTCRTPRDAQATAVYATAVQAAGAEDGDLPRAVGVQPDHLLDRLGSHLEDHAGHPHRLRPVRPGPPTHHGPEATDRSPLRLVDPPLVCGDHGDRIPRHVSRCRRTGREPGHVGDRTCPACAFRACRRRTGCGGSHRTSDTTARRNHCRRSPVHARRLTHSG